MRFDERTLEERALAAAAGVLGLGLGLSLLVRFIAPRNPVLYLRADLARLIIIAGLLLTLASYWTISPEVPQGGTATWRLDVKAAGSGVTGDLLAHCIDTALWHNGRIASVCSMTETFVKQRMHTETGRLEPVGIDDACAFLCRFENGSLGNFEATRYARGNKALYTLEINGEKASIRWDLHDLHRLEWFDHRDEGKLRGWRSIHVTDGGGEHPYMTHWWVPGLQIGYAETFVHQIPDFLSAMHNNSGELDTVGKAGHCGRCSKVPG